MTNNLITFDALKSQMKAKGITQQQVSRHIKAEDRHLWKTIKQGTVRQETLEKICLFLGLDLYLVNPKSGIHINLMQNEI